MNIYTFVSKFKKFPWQPAYVSCECNEIPFQTWGRYYWQTDDISIKCPFCKEIMELDNWRKNCRLDENEI